MKKILLNILVLSFLFGTSSCDLNLQENPNALTPDRADIDFVYNSLQNGVNEFFFELTEYSMGIMRLTNVAPRGGTYQTIWQGQDYDDSWEIAYAGILADANNLISVADASDLTLYRGIGKTIKAYTLMVLVDVYGDIPYTQALDASNLNPALDGSASVYEAAGVLLDEAIVDFGEEPSIRPAIDLFYGGDESKWLKLANTLKLRKLLNEKLVNGLNATEINGLASNIIGASDDWVFQFSTDASTTPTSRNPFFDDNYAGASDYMSNSFMNLLLTATTIQDPRTRYYFYRQTLTISSDPNELPCIVEVAPPHYGPDDVFCNAGNGYWGRDHLDTDGIPPDNQLRTTFGVYPIGGKFDADDDALATFNDGLGGAGIHPLFMSFYTDFMLAEASLDESSVVGDPATHLENGIRNSIGYVMSMGASVADPAFAPDQTAVDNYVSEIMGNFAAASDSEKMNIIGTEYYKALFGNGLEAYNLYRRTSTPNNLQAPLNPQAGNFLRTFPYPSNLINRNSNVTVKDLSTSRTFWDTNPNELK